MGSIAALNITIIEKEGREGDRCLASAERRRRHRERQQKMRKERQHPIYF
jgi:hypothetical protein